MISRRFFSLLLVVTVTVSTCACGTTTTVDLRSDPESSAVRTAFRAGEPIEVEGYTRVSDGHREWEGIIQLAPPDSVRFIAPARKTMTTTRAKRDRRLEFRIARADLASIDIDGYDTVPVPHVPPMVATSSTEVSLSQPDSVRSEPSIAPAPSPETISVVTTSPAHRSNRGKERALTIGLFVAVVGAAVIAYSVAGQ